MATRWACSTRRCWRAGAGAQVLARDPAQFKAGAKGARNRQPAQEKESRKWHQGVTRSAQAAAALEGSLVINSGDREADSYERLLQNLSRKRARCLHSSAR